jgi:hypothetical protein
MPDLVTHTFAAYVVTRFGPWGAARFLFYLGTILPDVVSRPVYILMPRWYEYTIALHTPLFIALLGLLLSEGFAPALRATARKALLAGAGLHFLLDMMQRHLSGGYLWLFPFSWRTFELGWFDTEATVGWTPVWVVAVIVI